MHAWNTPRHVLYDTVEHFDAARRNPFDRRSIIDIATSPPQSPMKAPPIPPKVLKNNIAVTVEGLSIHGDIQEIGQAEFGPAEHQQVADGHGEYVRTFGSSTLANPSSKISKGCDILLPLRVSAEYNDSEALRSK